MPIDTLIDKQDAAEIVRDQIASILAAEVASQMALATAAAEDPNLWDLGVYLERTNPWQDFLNADSTFIRPIVSIARESDTFDGNASNDYERQKASAIFNLDVYGFGVSQETATGHAAGDKAAALECQRGVRLVRNILMSATWFKLGLQGTVWRRWIDNIRFFQPQLDVVSVQNVIGGRISFRVDFNEFAPQVTPETLERIVIDVEQDETGLIYLTADYDVTGP